MAMMGVMWLFGLAGFALLIAVIAAIVHWLNRSHPDHRTSGPLSEGEDTAVRSLRERFARGEIDEREFRERLHTLESERSR